MDGRRGPTGDTDDAAFERQFAELASLAYRVAYRIVGDRDHASEIAQETLARAFVRWPRVRERSTGWVATVATNLALDHARRRTRQEAGRSTHPPVPDDVDSRALDATLDRAELIAALRRLPRRQREVVVLRYLADLSEAEVARTLGCSPGAVKTHAHRGLAAMRAALTETTATTRPLPHPALEDC